LKNVSVPITKAFACISASDTNALSSSASLLACTTPLEGDVAPLSEPCFCETTVKCLHKERGQTTSKNMLTWKNTPCLAYIQGLLYAGGGNHFCQPNGVTHGQAVAVVVKYIEARPREDARAVWGARHRSPDSGMALQALSGAMPLYWLCYRHDSQISIVIEPGACR
jgi:hypothetical protein